MLKMSLAQAWHHWWAAVAELRMREALKILSNHRRIFWDNSNYSLCTDLRPPIYPPRSGLLFIRVVWKQLLYPSRPPCRRAAALYDGTWTPNAGFRLKSSDLDERAGSRYISKPQNSLFKALSTIRTWSHPPAGSAVHYFGQWITDESCSHSKCSWCPFCRSNIWTLEKNPVPVHLWDIFCHVKHNKMWKDMNLLIHTKEMTNVLYERKQLFGEHCCD